MSADVSIHVGEFFFLTKLNGYLTVLQPFLSINI